MLGASIKMMVNRPGAQGRVAVESWLFSARFHRYMDFDGLMRARPAEVVRFPNTMSKRKL
jgi:hypothetical protein